MLEMRRGPRKGYNSEAKSGETRQQGRGRRKNQKENLRVLRLGEKRRARGRGRAGLDEVKDEDASRGRGGGDLVEEASKGDQTVDMGTGEARRGGRRAACTDPGELVGQEGGILGDEFAELDESLHGSGGGEEEREREEGMASVLLLFLVHFACPEVRTCSTRMHGQGN